jgi:AAA+ ATPase superfamily predicted ATPase
MDLPAAREFLPALAPAAFCEAYAACGGYPLHLKRWDSRAGTDENLIRLAGTPGGILLEDAAGILSEELPDTAGYPRILAAIGRGRTRYSEIASEADQRIERPLEILARAGLVRKDLPLAAPRGTRPSYRLDDLYLAFWFGVPFSDLALIQGGQGRAVLRRTRPRWQDHLGRAFEEMARAHALALVRQGRFPKDIVVGRWWSTRGQPCEVDILGMRGKETVLLGEAKWSDRMLGPSAVSGLRMKLACVPRPGPSPILALWSRSGASAAVRRTGVLAFSARDMVVTAVREP